MPVAHDRRDIVAAITIGLAAVAVSALGSGGASLWGDEAASIMSAERPLPSLFAMAQNVDAVHALYYLFLHFWIDAFGASPVSVRFPSAVGIGVTTAGLVLLGRHLRGLRFGVLAGIIGTVIPRLTDVGSEARSYAWTAAAATWLTFILLVQLQSPAARARLWVAYGALLGLGTALFIWVALVAFAHFLIVMTARTGTSPTTGLLRGWLLAAGTAMTAASPVLLFAYFERGQIAYLANRQSYNVLSLFVAPWFESSPVAIGGWLLIGGGSILIIQDCLRTEGRGRAQLLLPLGWLFIPAVILLTFSSIIPVYTPRYLSMCAPAVALLLAVPIEAFAASRQRTQAAIALAFVLALVAPVWVSQRGPYAKNDSDWARISAELARRAEPGDAVAFDDSVRPSRRPRLALRTYPAGFRGLRDPTLRSPYWQNTTWYDSTYTLAQAAALGRLDGVHRLWLVEYAISGVADSNGAAAPVDLGFHLTATIRNHRSAILEFERP